MIITDILKKALDKASSKSTATKIKLESPLAKTTCYTCALYQIMMNTLSQLRMDILSGMLKFSCTKSKMVLHNKLKTAGIY